MVIEREVALVRRLKATLVVLASLAVLAGAAFAAKRPPAGSLVTAFGDNGRIAVSVGRPVVAGGVVTRPGGRFVAVGHTVRRSGLDGGDLVAVGRLPDGRTDRSFGDSGRLVETLPGGTVIVRSVARQRDGSIVVAGSIGQNDVDQDAVVIRITRDGGLDGSFGIGGVARVDLGGTTEGANGVDVQADGRVVIAGSTALPAGGGYGSVARLHANGLPDPSFGSAGFVRLRTDSSTTAMSAVGVAIQPGGSVAVTGNMIESARQVSGLFAARYGPDGTPDPALGPLGYRTFRGLNHYVHAMAPDPRTGRLVLAGASGWERTRSLAVRLTSDLRLDRSFGRGDGHTTVPRSDRALAVTVDRRGRPVLAGSGLRGSSRSGPFVVARLTAAGRRDRSFGADGVVTTRFRRGWNVARAVALQRPNRILVAGGDARDSLESAGRTFDVAGYRR